MRIVTLALAAAIGTAAPVLAQTADSSPTGSPSLPPPEVVPAPAQQPPPAAETRSPPSQEKAQKPAQERAQEPTLPTPPRQAENAASPAPPAQAPSRRYSLNRVDDGFVRFDNATGQVAYCSPHTVGWACQAVSEDRAALDREIARLKDEIAALKDEIAKLRAAPPPPPPPPPPSPPAPAPSPPAAAPPADEGGDITLKVPTQEDIARAQAYLADTWHRLVEMIDRFQKNLRDGGRDRSDGMSSI